MDFNMQLTIIIIIVILFNFDENQGKECVCECCIDDNINCKPTFLSTVNLNPLLKCDEITCNRETCLIFAQCSMAFGKIVASCKIAEVFSSSAVERKFHWIFLLIIFVVGFETF